MDDKFPVQNSPYPVAPINPSAARFDKKKLIAAVLIIIILVALPLTVYISRQQQNLEQEAAPSLSSDTVIATFNGENITKGDLDAVASEQYDSSSIGKEALKIALDILLETKILDLEASEKGISAKSEESSALASEADFSEREAYYEILRGKIILRNVKSLKAVSIGFWTPPTTDRSKYTNAEWDDVQKQISDGNKALTEAEQSLRTGADPSGIVSAILNKYPSLTDSLALNGYIVSSLAEDEKGPTGEPIIYEYGGSNLDEEVKRKLFSSSLDVGSIVKISNTTSNSGGSVFKILEKGNEGGAESYDSWLSSKKNSLMTIKTPL